MDTRLLDGFAEAIYDPRGFSPEAKRHLFTFVNEGKFKIDHRPFSLKGREYLHPLYDISRENMPRRLVIMKPSQIGATAFQALCMLWAVIDDYPRKAGIYLPTRDLVNTWSQDRLRPLMTSSDKLLRLLREPPAEELASLRRLDPTDNTYLKQLGHGSLYISWMGGKATKESVPLDAASFDEVRKMELRDIGTAEERLKASDWARLIFASTAGFPSSDIHQLFLQSDQHEFHSACKCTCPCGAPGTVLTDQWPHCVDTTEWCYRCVKCGTRLDRPGEGVWAPHNDGDRARGYHIHRMIGWPVVPAADPKEVWHDWVTTDNRTEFYNSTLGLPHINPDAMGITEAQLLQCADSGVTWGPSPNPCFMGVDVRTQENHVVILEQVGEHRTNVIHVEAVQHDDPFWKGGTTGHGLAGLIKAFNVEICVINLEPFVNEAIRFAKSFLSQVFLVSYHPSQHTIVWKDQIPSRGVRKSKEDDLQFRYRVNADRYSSIERTLARFHQQRIHFPGEMGKHRPLLHYIRPDRGETEQSVDVAALWMLHMSRIARVEVPKQVASTEDGTRHHVETGEKRYTWRNVGIDPHFLHATNYALIAAARRQYTGEFAIYDTRPDQLPAADQIWQQVKPLTYALGDMGESTCQFCENFEAGKCRGYDLGPLLVRPTDPSCERFIARPEEQEGFD